MKESATYQAILEEGKDIGRIEGERNLLLLMGTRRFGQPDAETLAAVQAITSPERLEQLGERLMEAESWSELLKTP